jgi:hypothetical protein
LGLDLGHSHGRRRVLGEDLSGMEPHGGTARWCRRGDRGSRDGRRARWRSAVAIVSWRVRKPGAGGRGRDRGGCHSVRPVHLAGTGDRARGRSRHRVHRARRVRPRTPRLRVHRARDARRAGPGRVRLVSRPTATGVRHARRADVSVLGGSDRGSTGPRSTRRGISLPAARPRSRHGSGSSTSPATSTAGSIRWRSWSRPT